MTRSLTLFLISLSALAQTQPLAQVKTLKITVLSTMLADSGFGEWGFAALVEVDGRKLLFDTGAAPDTVQRNLRELKLSLGDVPELILSHNHPDHNGGLATLREDAMKQNAKALARAYTATGIFYQRARNGTLEQRDRYLRSGGTFTELNAPREIYPGVWLTGPVPRQYPERNFVTNGRAGTVTLPDGKSMEDNVPEDQSLVINTAQGLVVLSGCGHSGIINTLTYAQQKIRNAPVHAAIGGFHLFQADDKTLAWTADKLREMKLANFVGAHCTGIEAVYKLRELTGLTRQTCNVGAVGSSFTLEGGIAAGKIAK